MAVTATSIELTANVDHLGAAGQRVQVAPGRMRNHLYPSKLALYVLAGRTMHLDGSLGQALVSKEASSPSAMSPQLPSTTITLAQITAQLEKLGPLVFTRRTTGQDVLHGSVTSQNVLSALQERGVSLTDLDGEWQGKDNNEGLDHGKIKRLGEYVCKKSAIQRRAVRADACTLLFADFDPAYALQSMPRSIRNSFQSSCE
jgi:ribosomal protein L9